MSFKKRGGLTFVTLPFGFGFSYYRRRRFALANRRGRALLGL